jgi:hypothetical protein
MNSSLMAHQAADFLTAKMGISYFLSLISMLRKLTGFQKTMYGE